MLWEQVSCGIYLNIIQLAHSWPPTLFDGDIWFNVGYGIWWPKCNKNDRYFHVDHNRTTVVNDLLCLKTAHYMSQCPVCPCGTSFLTDKSNKFNIFQRKFLWDSSRLSIGPTIVKLICESHTRFACTLCTDLFSQWWNFLKTLKLKYFHLQCWGSSARQTTSTPAVLSRCWSRGWRTPSMRRRTKCWRPTTGSLWRCCTLSYLHTEAILSATCRQPSVSHLHVAC